MLHSPMHSFFLSLSHKRTNSIHMYVLLYIVHVQMKYNKDSYTLIVVVVHKIPIYEYKWWHSIDTLVVRLSVSSVYESPCCLFVPVRKWADSAIVFISIYNTIQTHTHTFILTFVCVCGSCGWCFISLYARTFCFVIILTLSLYVCMFVPSPSSLSFYYFPLLLSIL